MKKIFYSLYMFGAAILCLVAVSCSDVLEELTDVSYDRLFSPTGLEVRVRSQVNATVNWNTVNKAERYVVELYMGETVQTGTLVKEEQSTANTITFSKLEGDEKYAVRVKAVGASIPESKWAEKAFKTDAEQIFHDLDLNLLKATEVTLTWPAGEDVQTIKVTPGASRALTTTEIAEGKVVLTGLTPETAYTVNLLRGTKTRGTITFTTIIDLGDAKPVYADATQEELTAIFDALEAGDKVCLLPGEDGSSVFPTMAVTLKVPCSVMALVTKPVTTGISFTIDTDVAGDISIADLNFVGTKDNAFITVLNMAAGSNVKVSGCKIDTYKNLLLETDASTDVNLGDMTFDNCVVTNISGRGVDFQKKKVHFATFNFQNSTVYQACSGQDFLRFDYASKRVGAVYNVTNNTFYDVKASSKGLFYIRSNNAGDQAFTCNVSKNIFAFSSDVTDVFFSEDGKTDNVILSDNYYFNATSLIDSSVSGGKVYDTGGKVADPGFKDAANGDFTISNQDINYCKIGDPRWHQAL